MNVKIENEYARMMAGIDEFAARPPMLSALRTFLPSKPRLVFERFRRHIYVVICVKSAK